MQLGKKIRDLRCRRGFTVHQLAVASGLSKGFISQVENDRTSPSLATLRDLARALDTSVAYLVIEDDQAPYVVREGERPRIHSNGDTSRLEFAVIGDSVNTAAKLQNHTKIEKVLALTTAETRDLAARQGYDDKRCGEILSQRSVAGVANPMDLVVVR